MNTTTSDAQGPADSRAAVAAISVAVCMATLDASVTNTALPAIAGDLAVPAADVIRVVTAYQLTMVAAMLPVAALGEAVGHRRTFIAGLVVFAIASLGCGLAPSLSLLVLARALQGLGASAIMASNTALLRLLYPEKRLGHGLGLNALVVAAGLAGGPVVASVILSFASWHWLFLVNLPLCLFALWQGARTIPLAADAARRFDAIGSALCAAAFALLIHALVTAANDGSADLAIPELLVAMACVVALLRWQNRAAPILPVDLLKNRDFSLATVAAVCAFVAQGASLVALPFVFRRELGFTQAATGLLITPWPILGATMAPLAGKLSDRVPSAILSSAGLAILGLGIAGLSSLSGGVAGATVATLMAICGFGFGLFLSPNQRAIMTSAPAARSGSASGVLGVSRLLGQALGATLVAMVLSHAYPPSAALWFGSAAALVGCAGSMGRYFARAASRSGP